jgi:nicotinate phosphoribosyltransferase
MATRKKGKTMPVILSLTDNDLYKFTMQKAVLDRFPGVKVTYRFTNRGEHKFTTDFLAQLNAQIGLVSQLRLTTEESRFLLKTCPFLGDQYINWLSSYQFDPGEVSTKIVNDQLELEISGLWERTILWEVPLMAAISECYFADEDSERKNLRFDYEPATYRKGDTLSRVGVKFSDFGTRRRRSHSIQHLVVNALKQSGKEHFVGTSNVHFARLHEVRPIGTMAHEWIMGVSALESLRHANRFAMYHWSQAFKGDLGTALTDTFGQFAFWGDFDGYYARLFDSVRHDSGDPINFGDNTIAHYKKLGIDPMHKTIIFSDGLDVQKAWEIHARFFGKINTAFGIGTHFTNDVEGSKALNMVIKMTTCDGVPVVKLSDVPTKATGDKDAIRVAKWTFFRERL